MELSNSGADKLVVREGKKLKAYKDTKGIWTIGVGHTGPEVKAGLEWTEQQVMDAFRADVRWAVDAVNKTKSALTQNQFDALVSFTFNVGKSAFLNSTMKKFLDVGSYDAAAKEFDKWVIPKEITGRRMSEKAQFLGQ